MNRPIHFDLAEAEKQMRAQFAEINANAHPDGMSDRDRQFVRLQTELQDVMVATTLWHIRSKNDGIDGEIAMQALGCAIGQIVSSFSANCGYEPDFVVANIFDFALNVIEDFKSVPDEATPDRIVRKSQIGGIVGGRA